MTIRERIREAQRVCLSDELTPANARETLVQLSALYGNCLQEIREADHAYAVVLLSCLDASEAASRAKIRAETSPEYLRKREAHDTKDVALEMIRSLKVMLRSLDEEMRLAR